MFNLVSCSIESRDDPVVSRITYSGYTLFGVFVTVPLWMLMLS